MWWWFWSFKKYVIHINCNLIHIIICSFISSYMKSIAKKAPKYYESDTGLPIFTCLSSPKKRIFTISDLVTCLLHDKRFFCHKVPTQISSNVAFIIDMSSLDNSEDIEWWNGHMEKYQSWQVLCFCRNNY